jgi:hypothetical protein
MKEIKIKIYNMFLSLSSTYEGNACAIKQSIDTYYLHLLTFQMPIFLRLMHHFIIIV